jgi:hypothetical protein
MHLFDNSTEIDTGFSNGEMLINTDYYQYTGGSSSVKDVER